MKLFINTLKTLLNHIKHGKLSCLTDMRTNILNWEVGKPVCELLSISPYLKSI